MTPSSRLRQARKDQKLTQAQLAKKLGVYQQYIARWERGTHNPNLDQAIKLAKLLKMSVEELFKSS